MTAADPRCARLSDVSQCAYRLGLDFGREAEREPDWTRKLEYFRLFDRCFFAVRVATALELRLARAPAGEALAARDDLGDSAEPPEAERGDSDTALERDRPDAAPDRDHDRDREAEPASLPILLRTLEAVAAEAAALPGPEPAALPTLRELLAHVAPESPREPPPIAPRPDLRARLAGSGAAVTPPAPRPTGTLGGLALRRATGPPRR